MKLQTISNTINFVMAVAIFAIFILAQTGCAKRVKNDPVAQILAEQQETNTRKNILEGNF